MRNEYKKESTGQIVSFYTEWDADGDVTCETKDENGNILTSRAATFVTKDATSLTVDSAVSKGATQFNVSSTTGVEIGREYVLTNDLSQEEKVRVTGISADDYVIVDRRLANEYPVGSTLTSRYCEYSLQTSDLSDLMEGATFNIRYDRNSKQVDQRIVYDVVLCPLRNPLTRDALITYSPDISLQEYAEQDGSDFERQRCAAWERVSRIVRRLGFRPALIVDSNDLFDWAMAELALMLQSGGVKVMRSLEPEEAIAKLEERVDKEKQSAIGGLSWYDKNEDDAFTEGQEDGPLKLDFIR